ncbi:YcaO-like family protein [Sulfurimonas sp. SWIR-19]|uniref:YcaO-like family protein n=1 Tax=Sulfurimonas sp. SWIR-19 TaxID=2878390 RepID=UPI001CF1048F|nr:YcaO-like family protein [Sulfurimonas sp. SWIR-19]UCN01408.1 YcaO-like family protein [Sulfurimonas sp. SWIR-19]
MNFLSKEAPLQNSITTMKAVLSDVGCETVFQEHKNPLTHCFSVNLSSQEAPRHIYSNGKGVLRDASVASALGEYIERLQTNNFFIDFHLPKRKYYPDEVVFGFNEAGLSDELMAVYNPDGHLSPEDLVDFNSDYTDKIVALPFVKQSTQEHIPIPLNILSNLYVSNGLATGNTPLEAKVQALSEIFERHAKIAIIKNGYALPKFPDEVVKNFPKVYEDIQALQKLGYKVEVLDASLGGQFPVTAISLIDPKNATLFVSFGAHPILEVALERTMTELMQGRSLENLDSFEVPTFDMSLVSDSFNLESHFIDSNGKLGFLFLSAKKSFKYSLFSYKGNSTQDEYDCLTKILQDMKKEFYIREYDYLGFYSCQIIVPGISEVYPIEDLIYNNKNNGKLIRDMVLNFTKYDPQEIMLEIESLEDSLNMEKYIGVIFAKNFTMAEFKAQILLRLGEHDEALELLEYGTNKLGHLVVELARMQEMELDYEEYKEALYKVFSKEKVLKSLGILNNTDFLIETTLHKDYTNMLCLYDKLERKKCTMK